MLSCPKTVSVRRPGTDASNSLASYRNQLRQSPKKVRIAWYDYALRFCEKEDYLTHTEHLMIVSQKEA